jgi:redox-sensitive bicupin YhaK (pirin superfamily)
VSGDGWEARVFIGSLLGATSPVTTYSPLLGAELTLVAGTTLRIPVDASYELGVLVDTGSVRVDGEPLAAHELGFVEPGADAMELSADEDVRLLVLGGPPFGEQIVMWWNFIGRDHDEVVGYRAQWESLLAQGDRERFDLPDDDPLEALHAPPLPNARMVRRGP